MIGGGDRQVRFLLLVGAVVSLALIGGIPALIVVFSLVIMIVLHELGHYLAARWCGMQVTEFFLGFGPRIWSIRKGETEYGIKAIPAGAYVRITGMNNLEDVDPLLEDRTYRAQSYPRRLAVALAGSASHFFVAVFLLVLIFFTIGRPDPYSWTVGEIVPGSTADLMGIARGDRVLSVNDSDVESFDDFGGVVRLLAGENIEVSLERNEKVINENVKIGERLTVSGASVFPGLRPGDRVISIDGVLVSGWSEIISVISDGSPHRLTIYRGLETLDVVGSATAEFPDKAEAVTGFFGIGAEREMTTLGFVDSTGRALSRFGNLASMSVESLVRFFTPDGLLNFIGGAVDRSPGASTSEVSSSAEEDDNRLLSIYGAARLGSAMFESGLHDYLWFLVIINVFIGIFNLVPLLPLDGGHVAIATYERLRSWGGRRYQADVSKLIPVTWLVITVLVGVALVALYRDIVDFPDLG